MIYRDGSYVLETYQMSKSGRWRWKFSYNKRVLARADYHYADENAAKRAFMNMLKAGRKVFFRGSSY